jgi:hypothetical protein
MKEVKFKLPANADRVTVKVENGFVVASYKPKRWRADYNEEYYYIEDVEVKTFVEKYDELDYKLYDIGNYFRTREQAEEVAKEIRAIFEKHKNE